MTDLERVDRWIADHRRHSCTNVTQAWIEIIVRQHPSQRPTRFIFDPEGLLISVVPRFKAWWILRGSGITLPRRHGWTARFV